MKKLAVKITGVCSLILLCFLLVTDPQRLPSAALVVPFILIFSVLCGTIFSVLNLHALSGRGRFRAAAAVAAALVLLLVLRSLAQLTIRDTLATLLFFAFIYFYTHRFSMGPAD